MTEEKKFTAREPDFSGEGIAVWVEKDKNDKSYFVIKKPEWAKSVRAFKHVPKPKKKESDF